MVKNYASVSRNVSIMTCVRRFAVRISFLTEVSFQLVGGIVP
jgi:hypothetical protein